MVDSTGAHDRLEDRSLDSQKANQRGYRLRIRPWSRHLVDLVGQLGHDDGIPLLATAPEADGLHVGLGADGDGATT